MSASRQLNLPPTKVEPINQSAGKRLSTPERLVKPVNLLSITRRALVKCSLSQRWFAAVLGVSEQLASAQLADDRDDKHLSMRRLGRIEEPGFWREFLMLLAEDLGLTVVVLDAEQKQAAVDLQIASANYARVMAK